MGRPRKSTHQLKLAGTLQPCRHSQPEPEPIGDLIKPKGLDKQASWFWKQHIAQIKANGAGAGDLAILLSACWLWSLFIKFREKVEGGEDDYRVFIKMTMAWKNWNIAASRLGLTPTERAKLRIGGASLKVVDKFQEFLNKKAT